MAPLPQLPLPPSAGLDVASLTGREDTPLTPPTSFSEYLLCTALRNSSVVLRISGKEECTALTGTEERGQAHRGQAQKRGDRHRREGTGTEEREQAQKRGDRHRREVTGTQWTGTEERGQAHRGQAQKRGNRHREEMGAHLPGTLPPVYKGTDIILTLTYPP